MLRDNADIWYNNGKLAERVHSNDDGVVDVVAGEYRLADPMFAKYISRTAARIFTSMCPES